MEKEGHFKGRQSVRDAYLTSQTVFHNAWKNKQKYMPAKERVESILETLNIRLPDKLKNSITRNFEETALHAPPLLMNDAEMVLRALHGRYRIGLICDSGMSPGRVLKKILENYGILKYFFCTVFSDEIGCTKPNPIIFRKILEKLKVNANETVHVGDLLATDIAGAKAVGMKTIWFNHVPSCFISENESSGDETELLPDYEINKLSQLLPIIS